MRTTLLVSFCILLTAGAFTATARDAPPPEFPEFVRASTSVPVLMYHRATSTPGHSIDISPQRLEQHLRELARLGYTSISMRLWGAAQCEPHLLPDSPVVITFDDGWDGQYRYAAPLLEQYGFTGTFYVYTNVLRDSSAAGTFMSWQDAGDLVARGHEIGSHTLSHPVLTRLRPAALAREVTTSKARLEERLGITISTFAYPYGAQNDRVVEAVATAGYQTAVSTISGMNPLLLAKPYLVQRLNIGHRTTTAQFLAALDRPGLVIAAAATPPAFASGPVNLTALLAAR